MRRYTLQVEDLAGQAGIAASGHIETSRAAAHLLEAGGNAFDAALGALCAACVAEPMLASLGGGGFLMAQPARAPSVVHDFFVQTPGRHRPQAELEFYPITADFGAATQEFHIGMGSIAVPGVVAGLFEIHGRYCRLPLTEIMGPAIDLARNGVRVNPFQNYISHILAPILKASPCAMQLAATDEAPERIAGKDELVFHRDLANVLEALALEGPDLFYRGDLARQLAKDCEENGGLLSLQDLEQYRVIGREPVRFSSHGAEFSFNSPPSPSGCLVAFALGLLEESDLADHRWGHAFHCMSMGQAIQAAGQLRRESLLDSGLTEEKVSAILDPGHLASWRESLHHKAHFTRGTTHMSVVDAQGNLASMTISNGEGCAYVLPGTGIMLNNMLGEEDLSPGGFHRWTENVRMASMMCPSVASLPDGGCVALGSGGSNRIRSAILQVLVNLFEFDLPLEMAVVAPRLHLEGEHLSVEAGYEPAALESMIEEWPDHRIWPEANMFFGGVHAVERLPDGSFRGAGDPRRGGAVVRAGS
jgi:gamma-glutamyltranspeptidase/glutathione hydrolase